MLRALTGDLQGQVFDVGSGIVVGRATSCAVFVPDRRASREHLRIFPQGGDLILEDLGSHNGTFVNEQRVSRAKLHVGDTLRLGSTTFAVEDATASHDSEDSGAVKVISDLHHIAPRVVRAVEPISGPVNIATLNADDYFDAIGVGKTESLGADALPELIRKTRHFAILVEASRALQRYTDLQETLPGLLDLVLQVTAADRVALVLLDEDMQLMPKVVRVRRRHNGTLRPPKPEVIEDGLADEQLVMSKTIASLVLTDRCAVITADARADARFLTANSVMLNDVRSLAVVPVLVGNRMLGLLEVEDRHSVNAFDENDLHMLSVLASMIGVAQDHYEVSTARERAIADLKQAQAQLLAAQERLIGAERMGVLGRLSSGIAHEVKNHLGPFLLADMIAHKYPKDEAIQEAAEMMLEAQQRILELVDEIREFASGERANMDIKPCDMVHVVQRVVRFVQCDRHLSSFAIRVDVAGQPIVPMDSGRVRQVLINLIRNAAEASQAAGLEQGHIDITVSNDSTTARVAVRDYGTGIDAAVQERMFEPFFSTKGDRGLGLGLDLSRQIVRAHGGSLTFDSTPGKGTVFVMSLPLAPSMQHVPDDYDDGRTDPGGNRLPLTAL